MIREPLKKPNDPKNLEKPTIHPLKNQTHLILSPFKIRTSDESLSQGKTREK